jgi:hypothetical protein
MANSSLFFAYLEHFYNQLTAETAETAAAGGGTAKHEILHVTDS